MDQSEIKIFLVDDHTILRQGLRHILSGLPGLVVVGEAGNGMAALAQMRDSLPDVVILDVNLDNESGVDVCRQITTEFPAARVIMLTAYGDLATVTEALRAGAAGYVIKENGRAELERAVRTVMDHRTYLCPEVATLVTADYMKTLDNPTIPASKPLLSERERTLLKLVAEGKRNKEIAILLGVGARSVETYRSRLMKKLGCTSTGELVRYAIREGIATL